MQSNRQRCCVILVKDIITHKYVTMVSRLATSKHNRHEWRPLKSLLASCLGRATRCQIIRTPCAIQKQNQRNTANSHTHTHMHMLTTSLSASQVTEVLGCSLGDTLPCCLSPRQKLLLLFGQRLAAALLLTILFSFTLRGRQGQMMSSRS